MLKLKSVYAILIETFEDFILLTYTMIDDLYCINSLPRLPFPKDVISIKPSYPIVFVENCWGLIRKMSVF